MNCALYYAEVDLQYHIHTLLTTCTNLCLPFIPRTV